MITTSYDRARSCLRHARGQLDFARNPCRTSDAAEYPEILVERCPVPNLAGDFIVLPAVDDLSRDYDTEATLSTLGGLASKGPDQPSELTALTDSMVIGSSTSLPGPCRTSPSSCNESPGSKRTCRRP
jgi:hypothetical protein